MSTGLTINNHDRGAAGLTYVYPVLSRRAGGLSIGINFNINNACNWRCIYCQVPQLQRGAPPALDFVLLEQELSIFLDEVLYGNFFDRYHVPKQQRVIKDIAISGNGEPTELAEFAKAIRRIGEIATAKQVFPNSKFVLISNGSLMHLPRVQEGLKILSEYQGEVWFKLDSASEQGRRQINDCVLSQRKLIKNLSICTGLCTTKIQTCIIDYLHYPWNESERRAYLNLLEQLQQTIKIQQVLLYSVARASLQPEAKHIKSVCHEELKAFARRIEALGYSVQVS